MRKEDSLHQLIRSLDSSEKRLFKIFTNQNTSKKSNYIELFDVIGKMTNYDETLLKKKIKNANTLKNLAQAKKYLKELILKSMCEHDEKTTKDEVNELLKQAAFLNKKNQFKEQWKKLVKAQELAEKHELFTQILLILDQQMKYLIEFDFDASVKFLKPYKLKKKETLDKIIILESLYVSNRIVFQVLRKSNSSITKETKKMLSSEVAQYHEDKIIKFKSLRIENRFYTLKCNYLYILRENKNLLAYRKKNVDLFKDKPHFKNDYDFLIIYFNYITTIFRIGDMKLLKSELDNIEQYKLKTKNNEGEFFQNYVLNKLLYFLNTGNLDEAFSMNTEIKNGLKKYKHKINASSLMAILYNYTLIYLLNEDYNNALYWIDEIDNINSEVRKDLVSFSKVLKIICHYELENIALLESLYRSFKRNNESTVFELFLTKEIYKLSRSNSFEKKTIFENIINEIDQNSKKNYIVGKDFLKIWLKSKMHNKKLHSVYIELLSA